MGIRHKTTWEKIAVDAIRIDNGDRGQLEEVAYAGWGFNPATEREKIVEK